MNFDVRFKSGKKNKKEKKTQKDTTTQHCKFALKHAFLTYFKSYWVILIFAVEQFFCYGKERWLKCILILCQN